MKTPRAKDAVEPVALPDRPRNQGHDPNLASELMYGAGPAGMAALNAFNRERERLASEVAVWTASVAETDKPVAERRVARRQALEGSHQLANAIFEWRYISVFLMNFPNSKDIAHKLDVDADELYRYLSGLHEAIYRGPLYTVNDQNYTDEAPSSKAAVTPQLWMGDKETIDNFATRKGLTVAQLEEAADNWFAAHGEVSARATTGRAPTEPRLNWEKDALADENPAAFAWRAYQAEAKAGTLHRGVIGQEDKALAVKLASWLRSPANRELVPEGFDIPTKPEWNTRQLSKLEGEPARDVLRLYQVARKRRGSKLAAAVT
jgi:hypothetical protein